MLLRSACCNQDQRTRVSRVWWMRMIPHSRLYECDLCGARHLMIKRSYTSSSDRSDEFVSQTRLTLNAQTRSEAETLPPKHLSRALIVSISDRDSLPADQLPICSPQELSPLHDEVREDELIESTSREEETVSEPPLLPLPLIPTPFALS